MQYTFRLPKGAAALHYLADPSRQARFRLKILEYGKTHSVAATCRHFDIARSTYYRWRNRFVPSRLASLESRSSRPHTCRHPTWRADQVIRVRELRTQYPRTGKEKIALALRDEGLHLSASMTGRILTHLHKTQQLREPRSVSWRPNSRHRRPYATRKPRDYSACEPGDLIQLDTMQLRPLPGLIRSQFTAIDTVSRETVVDVYSTASAGLATAFLERLITSLSSPVRAIQVDGGSEFMAEFEQACQAKGIKLFVLPPRSPKLNGRVERANRTYRNEFYECYDGDLDLSSLRSALYAFQDSYNRHRPHQALGYLTPRAFLQARRL
jgi:transposase InsO family protein